MTKDMKTIGHLGGQARKVGAIERRLRDLPFLTAADRLRLERAIERVPQHAEVWHCEQPERYVVLEERWDFETELPTRHVLRVESRA